MMFLNFICISYSLETKHISKDNIIDSESLCINPRSFFSKRKTAKRAYKLYKHKKHIKKLLGKIV